MHKQQVKAGFYYVVHILFWDINMCVLSVKTLSKLYVGMVLHSYRN